MADLRISQLPVLTAAVLQSTDSLAAVDLSASETKQITAKDLIQAGVALIDAGSIPGDKVNVTLAAGSVGTLELADKAVTAAKLADSSTAVIAGALPVSGAYIGQLAVVTPSNTVSVWDGAAWKPFEAGITQIVGGNVGSITTTVTTVGTASSVIAQVDDATGRAEFLAGPSSSGGSVELRTIIPADLPLATATAAGIVAVPIGEGLRVDSGVNGLDANLEIDNDLAPSGDAYVVTYNNKGLILSGRPIQATDLPIATGGTPGSIAAGPEFTVQPDGILQHANQITAGMHPKVAYDDQGHITSGQDLDAADIPLLDASIIDSGTFPTELLADKSVTKAKLADYAIAYIQEVQPAITGADHVGILWYQESTAQLRMWNANSWMPVGFGRLSNENLRWGGLVNADTGLITGVTSAGTTAGLTIGSAVPAASDSLGGLYLLVSEAGDQISVVPGQNFDASDWVLCINEVEGWIRIDTATGGGGGGGGASTLNDLLDVTLSGASANQLLQLQANNQWQNVTLTAADFGGLVAGDNVSELVNDVGYLVAADLPADAVASVNGKVGVVVLTPADIGAATAAEGALAVTALQPGDDISELNNDSGYITAADIPALDYVPTGSWAALPSL